ncbi:MAG: PfkB family carbohydrate kinase, partial [Phycisphaerales bacterium]
SLRDALGFRCVVVHGQRRSAAASVDECASFDAPFTARPVISTGAGDHFNAGFVLASCLGLPLAERLACASAVAGRYVRTAHSPTRGELLSMLRDMPAPEGA